MPRTIPAATQVRLAVQKGGTGRFWRVEDFRGLAPASVAAELAALHADGVIRRLSKGLYYAPKKTVLGEAPPPVGDLVRELARGDRVVPAGLSAYNRLGLTTQIPARPIFATSKHFKVDGAEIVFRDLARYGRASDEALMLLDALAHIDKIADCPPAKAVRKICDMVASGWLPGLDLDEVGRVAATEARGGRARIVGLIGLIGDLTGKLSGEVRKKLKAALNPLTIARVGLPPDEFPSELRREWQIA